MTSTVLGEMPWLRVRLRSRAVHSDHSPTSCLRFVSLFSLLALAACSDNAPPADTETGESTQGDGDGDGDAGDGDGDSGDGDGSL